MTTSPKGYLFERIDYDLAAMNTLTENLGKAEDAVELLRVALHNTSTELEGRGQTITGIRTASGDVSLALEPTLTRITAIRNLVLNYGTSTETHAGRANALMQDVSDALAALTSAETDLADSRADLSTWESSDAYESWNSGEETSNRSAYSRDNGYRDAVESATTTRDLAESALDDAWEAWERAYESWDDAYARAVGALAGVDGGYASLADKTFLTSLADADTPAEVAAIWDSLDDTQKQHYIASYPDLIGNLEGIPYEYRIAANIKTLEDADSITWGEPTDGEIDVLRGELRRGGVPVSLNLFDKNQATAAMLYVDGFTYKEDTFADPLSGVTNINVLLGGMLTELKSFGDWGTTARGLNEAVPDQSATIVWFGYDTPNYGTVGSMDQAVTGAETLTNFLHSLDYLAPVDAVTTVIGHSYGSTTAFLAVGSASDNLGVDNLVAIGSAGLTDRALGDDPDARVNYSGTSIYSSISPEDRWAMTGRWAPAITDPLAWGQHAIDPGSIDGAVVFDSNGGYGPNEDGTAPTADHHDGDVLVQTPGHGTHAEGDFEIGNTSFPGGYLQDGSESFANIAEIIKTGEPLTTPGGYGSDDWWLW